MEVKQEADLCEFQSNCKGRFVKVLDCGSACVLNVDRCPSGRINGSIKEIERVSKKTKEKASKEKCKILFC